MGIKSGFLQPVQEKPANTQASANLLSSFAMIKMIIYFFITVFIKKIYIILLLLKLYLVYVHSSKDRRRCGRKQQN